MPSEETSLPVEVTPTEPEAECEKTSSPIQSRPTRVKTLPRKFEDYVMT